MESTLTRSKENMKVKIPEIQKALEIIDFMDKKQSICSLLSISIDSGMMIRSR